MNLCGATSHRLYPAPKKILCRHLRYAHLRLRNNVCQPTLVFTVSMGYPSRRVYFDNNGITTCTLFGFCHIRSIIEHGLRRTFLNVLCPNLTLACGLVIRTFQAPSHPQPKGSGRLPPTTLKGAMGSWRPSAGAVVGASETTRNPPAAVTGVAPWAFQTPKPPARLRATDRLQTTAKGAASVKPPTQSLKIPR